MKVRNGFVSNSSSSSFVILGKEISSSEIDKYENVYFVGNEFGEGTDCFLISDKFKEKYKSKTFNDGAFIAAVKAVDEDGLATFFSQDEISKIDNECKMFVFRASRHNSYDYDENYFNEEYVANEN